MIMVGRKNGAIENITLDRTTQIIKGYPTYTVIGGEFAIASEDENIALKTLLGSCVAMMFYDNEKHIYAMNHFLLPTTTSINDDMKYGLYSVEKMLNEMYKKGCKKQNIKAKISGGANMLGFVNNTTGIGRRNVEFAIDFCASEGFKIISNHTNGTKSRLILLTNNFQTFIKNVDSSSENINIVKNENILENELSSYSNMKKNSNKVELF
jgi:chemotaxis protein CheD